MSSPTVTCTNQKNEIVLNPSISNENGVLSYKGIIHAEEQGPGVMTVIVT
jgi:hypothetical protein